MDDILEALRKAAGCDYISDLRSFKRSYELHRIFENVAAGYSEKDAEEAYEYVFGAKRGKHR